MRLAPGLALLFALPALAQDPAKAMQLAAQAETTYNSGNYAGARSLADQAIQADPRCGKAFGIRGACRVMDGQLLAAIQDYSTALEVSPSELGVYHHRAHAYIVLDQPRLALEDAETALRTTNYPPFLGSRGQARILLGQVDEGLADIDQAQAALKDPAQCDHYAGYLAKADWKAILAEGREMERTRPDWSVGYLYEVIADMQLADYADANSSTERCTQRCRGDASIQMCRAYLHSFPAAKDLYDFDLALASVRKLNPPQTGSILINTAGRVFYESGRYDGAIQELEAHGRKTNFETLFMLAASYFRLGRLPEARRILADARRLNPYLSRHTDTVPGLTAFLKRIDDEVAKEQSTGDRAKLEAEHDTAALSVAELETLVRRFQFERALAGYKRSIATLASPARVAEAQARADQIGGVVSAFRRLREKLNAGALKDLKQKVADTEVTLTKAIDDQTFEFTMKGGGGKGVWASLGPEGLLAALDRASPTAEERLAMGFLAWDLTLRTRAMEDLQRAVKENAKLKGRLDAFVSARRGIEVPAGGFVAYKGAFATPEEKTNFEKGFVPFQGGWVTKADHEHLEKGQIQVGGKWVPGDEKTLVSMGFRNYKSKWYTREEYDALRSRWEDAFETKTDHYDIRTNFGEDFAAELGALCEVAYADYKAFYGGREPKLAASERMALYAFASYEDYRRYCVEHHAEAELQAAGFATSNSDIVVGWNKTGEPAEFLATMTHEAAHLYYFKIASGVAAPSWYAEGMATQFEGFHWTGSRYTYDRFSRSRLPFVRQAMEQGKQMPLDQLVAGDALTLINSDTDKALVFYAECWALVYFLTQTDRTEYREAFAKYREALDAGKAAKLAEFVTDMKALEADFAKFIRRM